MHDSGLLPRRAAMVGWLGVLIASGSAVRQRDLCRTTETVDVRVRHRVRPNARRNAPSTGVL